MEYEISKGTPTELFGREEKEKAVYALLEKLGIEFLQIDHLRLILWPTVQG